MNIPLINGRTFDWISITVLLPNGPSSTITAISYEDEDGSEAVYGKGRLPRAYGKGNYKNEGSLTIALDEQAEFELAVAAASGGKPFFDHKPFPIVVSFANDGDSKVIVHVLNGVKFKKRTFDQKQANKESVVKYDFFCIEAMTTNGLPAVDPGIIP